MGEGYGSGVWCTTTTEPMQALRLVTIMVVGMVVHHGGGYHMAVYHPDCYGASHDGWRPLVPVWWDGYSTI